MNQPAPTAPTRDPLDYTDLRLDELGIRDHGWRVEHVHTSFVAGTPGAPPIPGRPPQD